MSHDKTPIVEQQNGSAVYMLDKLRYCVKALAQHARSNKLVVVTGMAQACRRCDDENATLLVSHGM